MKSNTERENMSKSETIIVRVTDEMRKALQDAADIENVTISEIMRRLIDKLPRLGVIKDGLVEWYDNNKE
jgi:dihydroorotase